MLRELFEKIRISETPILIGFESADDVFGQFNVSKDTSNIQIIYANYDYGYYEGSADVYFYRRDTGKYYETYGSHCSCYGLEDQWSPEEIVFEELVNRLKPESILVTDELKALYESLKG